MIVDDQDSHQSSGSAVGLQRLASVECGHYDRPVPKRTGDTYAHSCADTNHHKITIAAWGLCFAPKTRTGPTNRRKAAATVDLASYNTSKALMIQD
jgi:hypothetical protein